MRVAQDVGELEAQRAARGGHRYGATTTLRTPPARISGKACGRLLERHDGADHAADAADVAREHVERVHLVAMARGVRPVHLHLLVVEDVRREPDRRRALRQAAEEEHAGARRRQLHRLLLRDVARARDDHDVGSEALRRAHDLRLHVDRLGVDVREPILPEDRLGEGEPVRAALAQQHLAGALESRERRVGRPDGAGADHDDRVVEPDRDVLVAADHVRERIGERRVRGGEAVGDAEQVLQRDLGDRHVLGVRPGVVEAHQLAAQAQVLVASEAHPAAPAPERRDAVHGVADRDAAERDLGRGGLADLEHLAADLVAEHPWRLDPAIAVVERSNVGAADAAGEHAQQHAVDRTGRIGHGAHRHESRAFPDCGAHASS